MHNYVYSRQAGSATAKLTMLQLYYLCPKALEQNICSDMAKMAKCYATAVLLLRLLSAAHNDDKVVMLGRNSKGGGGGVIKRKFNDETYAAYALDERGISLRGCVATQNG